MSSDLDHGHGHAKTVTLWRMTRKTPFLIVIAAALLTAGLSACGNKGPLFLPDHPPVSQLPPGPPEFTGDEPLVTPPAPADAPTETNDTPPAEASAPKPPVAR